MSYWDETPGILVGHTPTQLWVGPDEHVLRIQCGDVAVVANTDGDCCSESWWADIVGVKQMLGAEVTAAVVIDMPDVLDDERSRQEVDKAYGVRVTTTRGVCDLIYRNSSNGYYGGWSEWEVADDATPPGFRQITEDWSA